MKLNRLLIILIIASAVSGCAKKNNEANEQIATASAKLSGTWAQQSSAISYYDDLDNLLGTVSGPMVNLKLDNGLVQAIDKGSDQTQAGQYSVITQSRGNVLQITVGGVTHYYDITLLNPPNLTLSETIGGPDATHQAALGGRIVIYSKSVQENKYTSPDAGN
jgi:hypothetical protein